MRAITNAKLAELYSKEMRPFSYGGNQYSLIAGRIRKARTNFYNHYLRHHNLSRVFEKGLGKKTLGDLEQILEGKTKIPVKIEPVKKEAPKTSAPGASFYVSIRRTLRVSGE